MNIFMMSQSTGKTTGSASQTLNIKKEPATLFTQALRKCLTCDLFWCLPDEEVNGVISSNSNRIVNTMQPFSCNIFKFYIVPELYSKENFDQYFKYECNSDIKYQLLTKEHKDEWFAYFLQYISLPRNLFFKENPEPHNILITEHFYEKLDHTGILKLFMRCKTFGDLKKLLLILAGDVEQNPGPTYKDLCIDNHARRNVSRELKQEKRWKQDLKQLKKEKNDDFSYLKQYEKREVDMQIGGLMTTAATMVSSVYLGNRTRQTLNKLNNSADILTEEISKTLLQFREMFSGVQQFIFKGLDLISLVGDIMMGLLQISFAKPGYKLASLGVELFRILPKYGITGELIDLIRTYIHPQMTTKNVEMQIDSQDLLKLAGEITPTQVVLFLVTILSAVFLKAIPKTSQMESILKRVGDVCRSAKNVADFNNTMHTSLTVGLDAFKREVLGIRTGEEIEKFISGLDRWFDETQTLLSREDEWKKSDQILRDPHVIVEVENLYKRGLEFSREIADKKIQRELQLPFQTHMRMLSDCMKMVDTSGAFGTRPRTQPVVIWLFGESGVGKSGMSWPLAVDLNNMFVPNEDEAREFSKNIYMRNVEQEFWDNYQGQNVVIYDDFGQRVDSTGNPNEEFMELIRTANIAPYPLHMAHLEDKRKTRFTSKVLLLTSNVFEQSVNSLTFPDAFRRRIDLCARISNKDEFTKAGYSAATGKAVPRLDKKKVQLATGEVISTDVYEIELVNPESGISLEAGLSYEEFLERCRDAATDAFDSSRKMNEFLERYASSRFKTQKKEFSRAIPKKNVALQGDDQTLDFLDGKTFCEIEEELKKGNVVDLEHKRVSYEEAMLSTYNEYLESDSLEDYEAFAIRYATENYRYYVSRKNKILVKARNHAMSNLSKWKDEILEYSKNHPYIVASAIIGSISTIFLVSKFWTRIVGKPNNIKQLEEADLMGVKVRPYNEEKALDVSDCNESALMKILPTILTETAVSAGMSLVLRKPYPLIIGMISGLKKGVMIYVRNRIFDWHGQKYELVPQATRDAFEVTEKIVDVGSSLMTIPFCFEASASADAVTLKQQQPRMEANVSSDAVTQKQTHVKVEASPSGDCRTLARTHTRMEIADKAVDMQVWKDQVAQNVISNNVFSNLYKILRVVKGQDGKEMTTPLLHGMFIRGNVMLVPGHLNGFLQAEDEIELLNAFDVKFRLPWKSIQKIPITDVDGGSKEAMLLAMPKYVSAHKDIVKHFSDSESMCRYKKASVALPTLRYSDKFKRLIMYILGTMEASALDRPLYLNDEVKQYKTVLREGLIYAAPTKSGDCGAPLIINETQVLRKIAGIHVAGDVDGGCYAESITQKDLERSLKHVDISLQIKVDFDDFVKTPIDSSLPLNEEFNPVEYVDCDLPGDKFLPVGKVAQSPFEPGKTELRKSLVFGKIDKILTKPAKLRDEFVNGEKVKLKHKNLLKCALDTPYIDQDIVDRAYEFVKQKWLTNKSTRLTRILTWEESIIGSPDSEYLGPINRQSSPGYPWIFMREKGKKGKTGWFGDDEYVLSPEVFDAVQHRINQAKKGIRVPTVWIDTLKDERRPIAKVDAFKTRVFSNGPMDYSIAFRQYFLGFIAHLMENRIENEVSIGTNVYSQDWKKTALKLKRKGKKVIAGDFSTFDGSLNSCLMSKFVDLANEFYDDGTENALIRQTLFIEVYNSVHLCDGSVYMMTHSQPSGNPATTPLNCFINSMGLRICFEICARMFNVPYSMKNFDEHVSMVSYGDDNVINFSDTVSGWFNMDTITAAFAQIGFTYTDETKSERGTAPLWRELHEVAYLKRNFRFDEERRVWEAPLSMDTILEMPNWCRGGLDIEEGTKVNCENAIMELSMHERPVFDKWKKKIANAFSEATGNQLSIDTYVGYAQQRYMDYYL